jgi:hypothetical protein
MTYDVNTNNNKKDDYLNDLIITTKTKKIDKYYLSLSFKN